MKRRRFIVTLAAVLALAFGAFGLAGCGAQQEQLLEQLKAEQAQTEAPVAEEGGGVILLKVNPEIAIYYDEFGVVTAVEGRNDDGRALVSDDAEYLGKECRAVVSALVGKIKDAGYIVEEVEGEGNRIVLEVEDGSQLPSDNFLNGIVSDVHGYLGGHNLTAAVDVEGESAYGWTNYGDTDYGPGNDGATDYSGTSDYGNSAYASAGGQAAGAAGDTDYGPGNDGVTDYGGNSNYGNSSYGSSGNTNYSNYGNTGGGSNSGSAAPAPAPDPAPAPAPEPAPAPDPAPSGGNSGYGDSSYGGNSNYGGGDSGYDGGNSGYDDGDSGYDD